MAIAEPTQNVKAVKATIYLGNIPLEVYQLPDGSYKLYTPSVTSAIDRESPDLLRFLKGKSPQALPYKDYNLVHAPSVEIEGEAIFIKPIPVFLATSYWLYWAMKGNKMAQALAQACMMESLERRADKAFSTQRSETEYNQRFAQTWEEFLSEDRMEIETRRLPGDDFYYPIGIN